MRDTPTPGGSSSELVGKFDEMVRLMADRAIDEMPTGYFQESIDDADFQPMGDKTARGGKVEKVTGGYTVTDSAAVWYYLTRESPQWLEFHTKYETELATLRRSIGDLESWRHDPPISHLEWVYQALYQRDFLSGDDFTKLEESHPEITGNLGSDVPVWENIDQVTRDTDSWGGHFIKALSDIYLSQLPHILLGQMAVTGYLLGSLQMSQAAVEQAEQDIGNVLDGTIKALEELGQVDDISLSETLDVVSKATGLVSAVSALIPAGQGVAGGLALVSTITGLGGELAGNIESKPDAGATEMKISGDTVDDIADSLQTEAKKCLNQIAAVENSCADMLSDLSETIGQTNVVNENIDTAAVPLTSRDAYFRPRPVTGGEGGQRLAGDSSTGNLEIEDVNLLALIGAKTFPALATEYRSMNEDLMSVEKGFLSEALVRTTIGEASHLHETWTQVQGQLSKLFTESATNLDDVGDVVVSAALDIEGTDQANGTSIDRSTRELIEGDH